MYAAMRASSSGAKVTSDSLTASSVRPSNLRHHGGEHAVLRAGEELEDAFGIGLVHGLAEDSRRPSATVVSAASTGFLCRPRRSTTRSQAASALSLRHAPHVVVGLLAGQQLLAASRRPGACPRGTAGARTSRRSGGAARAAAGSARRGRSRRRARERRKVNAQPLDDRRRAFDGLDLESEMGAGDAHDGGIVTDRLEGFARALGDHQVALELQQHHGNAQCRQLRTPRPRARSGAGARRPPRRASRAARPPGPRPTRDGSHCPASRRRRCTLAAPAW